LGEIFGNGDEIRFWKIVCQYGSFTIFFCVGKTWLVRNAIPMLLDKDDYVYLEGFKSWICFQWLEDLIND
jgi:hypothetical protein